MVVGTRKERNRCIIDPTLEQSVIEVDKFRENLRFIREKYGASEYEIAKTFGVDHSTIHRWESGEREPDIFNYERARQWANELKRRSASY